MKRPIFLLILNLFFAIAIAAQPRPIEKQEAPKPPPPPAPSSFEAKYEGGVYGYSENEKGTLKFDDENERLVFFGKDQKEKFSISYDDMLVVYRSETKVQSGSGRTLENIPLPGAGIAGSLMKKKKYRLVIRFSDADVDVQGVTNFLLDTDQLLESVLAAIGEKAKLKKRGDAFFRPKEKPIT